MIYATNSSFRLVEHPTFIKAVQMLRPGYKLPDRKAIGGRLLDIVHDRHQNTCKDQLNGKTVCMSLDGWSNVHNEPIVCVAVTDEEGNTFVTDTIDTSGHAHSTNYLEEIASTTITKAETTYGCRIGSFVTDNAANMAAMRRELHKDSDKPIITYGCGAHMLNLLAKDLEVPNVHKHVVKVIKYFRNTHLPAAW